MKLTGKCKEEFKKWYFKDIKSNSEKLISNTDVNYFYLLTESMQYGVLEDYFDSLGVEIGIYKLISINKLSFTINGGVFFGIKNDFNTRPEARTAATEKADEIHNSNLESF